MASRPKIFCIEGDWGFGFDDTLSVRSYLDLVVNLGHASAAIHRTAATRQEFEYYLDQWLRRKPQTYPLAFLASHGDSGAIHLGNEEITLDELAEIIGPRRAEGRVFHFGACSVMRLDAKSLKDFCARTGAAAIVGYTEDVDWLDAAACDLMILPMLCDMTQNNPRFDGRTVKGVMQQFAAKHAGFVEDLGLTIATPTWNSRGANVAKA